MIVSGFLWVAWVQLDYIRKTFFQFKMSHCALCSPRSVHSFIVLSEDEGHNIRTLMFLTGLVDLGKRWTKRARTAKWHDSCWGRTLDGGSYTLKRSRAYITDHNQEMKKWRNHNSNHCSNQKYQVENIVIVLLWLLTCQINSVWLDEFSWEPVFIIKTKPTQTVTLLNRTGTMIRVFSCGSPMLALRLLSPWSPAEAGCDVTT